MNETQRQTRNNRALEDRYIHKIMVKKNMWRDTGSNEQRDTATTPTNIYHKRFYIYIPKRKWRSDMMWCLYSELIEQWKRCPQKKNEKKVFCRKTSRRKYSLCRNQYWQYEYIVEQMLVAQNCFNLNLQYIRCVEYTFDYDSLRRFWCVQRLRHHIKTITNKKPKWKKQCLARIFLYWSKINVLCNVI